MSKNIKILIVDEKPEDVNAKVMSRGQGIDVGMGLSLTNHGEATLWVFPAMEIEE